MTITMVDVGLEHPHGSGSLVANANLSVAPGEVVLIVGAAGVGTSRIVAAALGELPHDGRIEVLGRDVGRLRRSSLRLLRRRIGIVPQELSLLDDRNAQLNVVLPLEIDGVPRSASIARAAKILEQLGLAREATVSVDQLSASARQRVAVARALVRDPELVIADHPTSMQDAEGAELVCAALAARAATGRTAVLILGRDPALRIIAERLGWRQLVLVDGALTPMSEVKLDGTTMEELIVGIETAPVRAAPERIEPEVTPDNIVPFPAAVGAR